MPTTKIKCLWPSYFTCSISRPKVLILSNKAKNSASWLPWLSWLDFLEEQVEEYEDIMECRTSQDQLQNHLIFAFQIPRLLLNWPNSATFTLSCANTLWWTYPPAPLTSPSTHTTQVFRIKFMYPKLDSLLCL